MQEQWEIRWMDYYQVFQLQSEAEPEVIRAVYKKLAAKYHPDNKETGDEEKFKVLNEVYEVLADPARRASYDNAYTQRQLANESRNQAAQDAQKRRAAAAQKAREEQRQREEQARQQEEEIWRQKRLPIVYPLFQRPFRYQLYEIYDYLDRSGDETGAWLGMEVISALLIVLFGLPVALFGDFALLLGQDSSQLSNAGGVVFLGWLGLWGTFVCGNLFADYSLHKIQTARKPQKTAWMGPQQVWEAVEQVWHSYRYHGHGWAVEDKTEDGEDATEKLVARLAFSYKLLGCIALPYAVTVTIKVKASDAIGASQVCYWFDVQRPWYWLLPAATVVKHTNALLLKLLAVETLAPEAQPCTLEQRRADRCLAMRLGATAVFLWVMGPPARKFSAWLEQLIHEPSTSFVDGLFLGCGLLALDVGRFLAFGGGLLLTFVTIGLIWSAKRGQR